MTTEVQQTTDNNRNRGTRNYMSTTRTISVKG